MKKTLLIFFLIFSKSFFSQNGFTSYSTSIPSSSSLPSRCIYEDNSGKVWMGYQASLSASVIVSVYNTTTTTWTIYNKTNTPSLPAPISVNCFKEDNLGNMWIGTTRGLVKFDGTNFTNYTIVNGLPDTVIYSLEFNSNMLFIGTNRGLSRFDGTNFTNYNISNGLFPTNSIWSLRAENSNTIWACNSNSIVQFTYNPTFTSTGFTTAVSTITTGINFSNLYIDSNGDKWLTSSYGPTKFSGGIFSYFKDLYPDNNYNGYGQGGLCKGPNGGVMYIGENALSHAFLVELLPGNRINYFHPKKGTNLRGSLFTNASGKILIASLQSTMLYQGIIHFINFDETLYSELEAFRNNDFIINQNNTKNLDINQVKAKIMNRGDMHWDVTAGGPMYEVPKGSGVHSGLCNSFWIGGLDASNQLHLAAQRYRMKGCDFWPGALDTLNGEADTLNAFNYDHIWKVSYTDINNFITQFNLGNVPLSYTPTPDIVNWPANGTGNKAKNLAPFVDVNGDGIYNWQQGDYPKIKGDQALYFIFNDKLGNHTESGGLPLGIEIHCMAYAYGCPNIINGRNELAYTTFYDYKIYNRSNNNYHDMYILNWSDPDLGNYVDDYVGCSVHDNLGFVYNADTLDETYGGAAGYQKFTPATGHIVLNGPLATAGDLIDNDQDSIIDEPGEKCLMSAFTHSTGGIYQFPPNHLKYPYRYHNYMEGRWYDSTNFTCGGNAYGGTTPTKFVFPWMNYQNNPCAGNWSESSAGNWPSDRTYHISSGPFNLPSKGQTEFEHALVWSVDSAATSNRNIASVNKLIQDARKVKSFYSGAIPNCLQKVNIQENKSIKHLIDLYPNPAQTYIQIKSDIEFGKCTYNITDVLGRNIKSGQLNGLNQSTIHINELNAGVYFLNINFNSNEIVVKKFVKQ
ncbi:MAG: T9SS type A sorting domain-containing protein [Bacteroidia bacterium]|nr:T9SS type A sorting domain-containing protein [Bacteroidia bacterium]